MILTEKPVVDYIVLPECSLPPSWAPGIAHKLAQHGVSLIAGLEYRINEQFGAEFLYLKQNTHATSTYGMYDSKGDISLTHQYYLVSGLASFIKGQKLEPYGGALLGAAVLEAQEPKLQSDKHETKFAFGFRGGLNYWVMSRVGLKLQVQYLLVPKGVGGDLYYDSKNNPENPAMYTSLSQFIAGGGLTIRLGRMPKHS